MAASCYAAVALLLAIGFGFQMEWATRLWPWPEGRLTYIFISSILAVVAASVATWVYTNEPAEGQALALVTFVAAAAGAVQFARVYRRTDEDQLLTAAVVFGLAVLVSAAIAIWSFRFSFRDTVPTPTFLRWTFAGYVVALVITGLAMIAKVDTIFPWPLNPDSSVLFGWVFLGAAVYFLHAVLVPYRNNARGQLAGFLAYDLVLIVPFLRHFSEVADDHFLSLLTYTAVIIFSGAVAVYYLFFEPRLRLFTIRQLRAKASPAG
jgi:hypothetical protein